ncbi:MAG: glycosyltransferase family 4 protein [Alphaproteobacteria bacterium]
MMPPQVVIVQRVVASYRQPLFEVLAKHAGWQVAAASNFPTGTGLQAITSAPWLHLFPFRFGRSAYTCWVPLGNIIRTLQPDVLILEAGTTMSSTWLPALTWPLLRRLGFHRPKLVLWGHGAAVSFSTNPVKRLISNTLRRWLLRQVDGYICYTAADAQALKPLAPYTPIDHFNNTLDITPMLALRQPMKPSKDKHILMLGRITPDKRFAEAIHLMPHIWEKAPHAQLTIIGGGEGLAELKALAGAELNHRIHLPGALFNEAELAPYFNRSQLYWLMGAAGLGVNHALAYGLPVLAYAPNLPHGPLHHPEIAYVIPHTTGWLVPKATPEAMLTTLTDLLTHPQTPRAQRGEPLTTYATTHLTISHSVERMVDFITAITAHKKGA